MAVGRSVGALADSKTIGVDIYIYLFTAVRKSAEMRFGVIAVLDVFACFGLLVEDSETVSFMVEELPLIAIVAIFVKII